MDCVKQVETKVVINSTSSKIFFPKERSHWVSSGVGTEPTASHLESSFWNQGGEEECIQVFVLCAHYIRFASSLLNIPYSRKYWRELNLVVGSKIAIAKILVDLNLVVR